MTAWTETLIGLGAFSGVMLLISFLGVCAYYIGILKCYGSMDGIRIHEKIMKLKGILKKIENKRDILKIGFNIDDIDDRIDEVKTYICNLEMELEKLQTKKILKNNRKLDFIMKLEQDAEIKELQIDDNFEEELLLYAKGLK